MFSHSVACLRQGGNVSNSVPDLKLADKSAERNLGLLQKRRFVADSKELAGDSAFLVVNLKG